MVFHILVVDDDTLLRRSLAFSLEQAGYRASTAANAEDALALAQRDRPDLVILDIGLPGMDGLGALRYFSTQIGVPVVFLTAHRRELDEVLGLELGADDYITKPFDVDVFLARIKVVLRRTVLTAAHPNGPTPLTVGDMRIAASTHTVTIGDRLVDLPPREFKLLHTLALEAGHTVSIDELLTHAWGTEYEGKAEAVYVHIHYLREQLEEDAGRPRRIVTVRGVGYKLEPQKAEAKLT
jgi:DNA-binding response OmpR family regulator